MEQLVTKPLWQLLLSAALRANVSSMFPPSTQNTLVQRANCCVNSWLGWLIHTLKTDLCFHCLLPCIWNDGVNCKFLFWLNVCGGGCGPDVYISLQGNCSLTFNIAHCCCSYACYVPKGTKFCDQTGCNRKNILLLVSWCIWSCLSIHLSELHPLYYHKTSFCQ